MRTSPDFAQIWQRLLQGTGTQLWPDWVSAMSSLGYEMLTVPGAARMFEISDTDGRAREQAREQGLPLHISFHQPHKNKVDRLYARNEWIDRFQRRGITFELAVESLS